MKHLFSSSQLACYKSRQASKPGLANFKTHALPIVAHLEPTFFFFLSRFAFCNNHGFRGRCRDTTYRGVLLTLYPVPTITTFLQHSNRVRKLVLLRLIYSVVSLCHTGNTELFLPTKIFLVLLLPSPVRVRMRMRALSLSSLPLFPTTNLFFPSRIFFILRILCK